MLSKTKANVDMPTEPPNFTELGQSCCQFFLLINSFGAMLPLTQTERYLIIFIVTGLLVLQRGQNRLFYDGFAAQQETRRGKSPHI